MKFLLMFSRVIILIILITNSIFSQKGNDTITVIDVKSLMEPHQNKNPDTIAYMFVEQVAEFPGGRDSLNSYVKTYLFSNSRQIVKNKKMVLCIVTIEKNGCISEVEILAPNIHYLDLENAIKNALYSSPAWTPALQEGKKLRFKTFLPFHFP